MKFKFKDRYILGKGYPNILIYEVYLSENPETDRPRIELNTPKDLLFKDCPKYKLVLERIK